MIKINWAFNPQYCIKKKGGEGRSGPISNIAKNHRKNFSEGPFKKIKMEVVSLLLSEIFGSQINSYPSITKLFNVSDSKPLFRLTESL